METTNPAGPAVIELTPRQQLLVDSVAIGMTITKAAERVGITRKTAYNYLENEAVRAALDERRRELASRVADRIADLGQTCLTTLISYVGGDEVGESNYGEPSRVKLAERLLEKLGLLGGKPAD
jgi:hypothetical protein